MTVAISQLANSQNFGSFQTKLNQMATVFSSNVVTADSSANGSITTGNVAVNGNIWCSGSVFLGNYVYGGNPTNQANVVFASNATFTSNVTFSANVNYTATVTYSNTVANTINANLVVCNVISFSNSGIVTGGSVTFSSTSAAVLDQFPIATYRSARYALQGTCANSYQFLGINILHDGVNPYVVQFGDISSNGDLGSFTAGIVGANLQLSFTPIGTPTVVKFNKELMAI